MLRALAELVGLVRPSGDGLVLALAPALEGVPTFEEGWRRLCETAWALGFVALRITPAAGQAGSLPAVSATVPGGGVETSAWGFEVVVGGDRVATVTARRGANGLDFDSRRFREAVGQLVARFVEPSSPS